MSETGIIWLIVIVLFIVLIHMRSSSGKGWLGEREVALILYDLPIDEYKVIHNVMLQTANGTTQIDHVVVSVYGIFVIETKNYKGWITGSEYGERWTKNMYGKKYQFLNPIRQNYGHVKALETTLGVAEEKFIPIVVFLFDANIMVKAKSPVVYTGQLRQEIESHRENKLSVRDVDEILNRLNSLNIKDSKVRRTHVQTIQRDIRRNEETIAQGKCPRCGGELKNRQGKYGPFRGCSNYPKCKYTTNIMLDNEQKRSVSDGVIWQQGTNFFEKRK
ncbi:hypothetical protein M2150_001036 [Lachnospiraceae bacterium PM6-15]